MIDAQELDKRLIEWHWWCKGYLICSQPKTSAMFATAKSSRQWDSEHSVNDDLLNHSEMESLDFQIDQLLPIQRTAIQINARNLATGRSVWRSARLPEDIEERQTILREARNALCKLLG